MISGSPFDEAALEKMARELFFQDGITLEFGGSAPGPPRGAPPLGLPTESKPPVTSFASLGAAGHDPHAALGLLATPLPLTPSLGGSPVTPSPAGLPVTPSAAGLPAPSAAGLPATPWAGGLPPTPSAGGLPATPLPATPSVGGLPATSSVGGLPVTPSAGALPATPSAGSLPVTPSAGGLPAMPSAGGLPATPSVGGLSATPSAGGMPSTPQPPIPDAPQFYFLDEAQAAAPVATPSFTGEPGAEPREFAITEPVIPRLDPSPGIFDVASIRKDFPILEERVHGKPLIWLDNAATTQKPRAVIDRISSFYQHEYSNIHRAAHALAARSTDAYEGAREKVRRFLNAPSTNDIIFTRGTTEAINLVAKAWGGRNVRKGDEIVITWLEHHSNIVPWQQLAAEKEAKLRVAPIDDRGAVILEEYEKLLNPRTRIVSLSHVSNALGTINPVKAMVAAAHRHGAKVLVDGAQSVSHLRVDVQELDADFYAFSGHKVFGPTGIGVLFGRSDIMNQTPPWQGGGNMISDVTFERTTYHVAPMRFEAGTGSIVDAVGLGAALDYVSRLGMENIARYEHELLVYATECLRAVPGLRLIGTAPEKASVLSFVLDGFRSEDVGTALDREGIAVRAGHHCAQPALRRFGLETSVRPSLALYNTKGDVDALALALHRLTANHPIPRIA